MYNPLVSVIINCLNGEAYLQQALDSVYAQSYSHWEIIFWDNASTDNTANIARAYSEKLKYFCSKKTLPLGEARVLATAQATGKLLAFLDADDYWYRDKLTRQVHQFDLAAGKIAFVYGRSEILNTTTATKKLAAARYHRLPQGHISEELIKGNFIVFSSVMVDKEKFHTVGGFPADFKHSTDYSLFLRLACQYPVAAIEETCCVYRQHGNSLSSKQAVLGQQEALHALQQLADKRDISHGLKHHYLSLMRLQCRQGKFFSALKLFFDKNLLSVFIEKMASYFLQKQRSKS